jgi:hypothetical protein
LVPDEFCFIPVPGRIKSRPMKLKTGKNVDWSLADGLWASLHNRDIAQRLGTTYARVKAERNKRIHEAIKKRQSITPFQSPARKSHQCDWKQADGLWPRLNNKELAQILGLSPARVTAMRRGLILKARRLGKSPLPYIFTG